MKKLLTFLVLGITVLVIGACSGSTTGDNDKVSLFDDKENVLGFSVLTGIQALQSISEEEKVLLSQKSIVEKEPVFTLLNYESEWEILSEIEELTPFLDIISTFAGNGNFDVVVSDLDNDEYPEYEHQMVISSSNMKGETVQHVMYYNETITDQDEEDGEFESEIKGIMVVDGVVYTLEGTREIEEGEEEFELIASIDDENYITIEYEAESDDGETETEFVLEMFINNQLVKRTEIEFEQEDGEMEMSLKFVQGNRESEYEFEIEQDGNETTIEIEYKIIENGQVIEEGEAEVSIIYNAETGQSIIRYEIERNGEKVIVDDDYDTPEYDDDDEEKNDDTDDEEVEEEENNDEEDGEVQ